MAAGLLGQDRVAREAAPDLRDHQLLGAEVDIGHHIAAALAVDLLDAPVSGLDDLAGLPRHIRGEGQLQLPGGHGGMLAVRP